MPNRRSEVIDGKKLCGSCGEWLPLDDFYPHKRLTSGRTTACKECSKAAHRAWSKANPEKVTEYYRASHRMVKYGIDRETYEEMKSRGCHICGVTDNTADGKDFPVDHCHERNIVRGILCSHCNLGLGHFKDNPRTLRLAADYIEAFEASLLDDTFTRELA